MSATYASSGGGGLMTVDVTNWLEIPEDADVYCGCLLHVRLVLCH